MPQAPSSSPPNGAYFDLFAISYCKNTKKDIIGDFFVEKFVGVGRGVRGVKDFEREKEIDARLDKTNFLSEV